MRKNKEKVVREESGSTNSGWKVVLEKVKVYREKKHQERVDSGDAELPVLRVGTNKRAVRILWGLMIASLAFGIYKNFTAVDTNTVHERMVVEAKVQDTNELENFVERFAYIYHAWATDQNARSERQELLKSYMSDALAGLNGMVIGTDCPTSSQVLDVRICKVADLGDNAYRVRYMVKQLLTETGSDETASISKKELPVVATSQQMEEGDSSTVVVDDFEGTQTGETAEDVTEQPELGTELSDSADADVDAEVKTSYGDAVTLSTETVRNEDGSVTTNTTRQSYFEIEVYVDEAGGMVVVTSPTSCGVPGKADYNGKEYQTDGTVDSASMLQIEDFLNTFFGMYPTATEKELAYYAVPGTMDVIGADYVYDGLYDATYYKEDDQIMAHVYVKYLDQVAKVTEISEYTLTLEKGDNWRIVAAE
ncbi:MAG: conjugal transfer protein [Roseburia hominis]